MKEIEQLNKAHAILTNVLSSTGPMSDKQAIQEVRSHIRQAINKLEHVSKKHTRKQNAVTEYQKWWGQITSNVANAPMASETAQAVLGHLDKMINEEKSKLADLEQQSQNLHQDGDDEKLLTN